MPRAPSSSEPIRREDGERESDGNGRITARLGNAANPSRRVRGKSPDSGRSSPLSSGHTQITSVHQGQVCEGGVTYTGGRQLLDDFGVDTDPSGWAHIAYSHDSPDLGGSGAYTGYAVQQGGTPVGAPN